MEQPFAQSAYWNETAVLEIASTPAESELYCYYNSKAQSQSSAVNSGVKSQTRILIVDDDVFVNESLSRTLLHMNYIVKCACSAEEALEILGLIPFDLVICDMKMGAMSGLDLTRIVSQSYSSLPIVMITGQCDIKLMREAIQQGASDFITKPFDIMNIPFIIESNLERHSMMRKRLHNYEHNLMLSNVEVLAAAMDAKEPYTAQHSRRVAQLSVAIARKLGLSEEEIELVEVAGNVHDVGKIGMPNYILNKPGSLNEVEWKLMRQHPIQSAEIVGRVSHLVQVAAIVRAHHERIDGAGYPDHLKGEEIPYLSRIIAVADAFEAMTSNRIYRDAFSREEALQRLQESAGSQFDLQIVEIFLQMEPIEFRS